MRKIFLQIIVCIISQSVFSQSLSNDNILQVYPPNAYALARYGDIPVDYSTGIPDISIPLMSISDKDITVDISLSYHARGIKVDQDANWVGLGWVLNAGGVITRDIRGAEDIGQKRPIINDFKWTGSDYNKSLDDYIDKEVPTMQGLSNPNDFYDSESDIYYYNFNGRSGKFFLDNNNNVCLFKHDDIKIDRKTFDITDEFGVKYIFGKPVSVSQGGKTYTTSWYLTKIISPSGGEINFEYKNASSNAATKRAYSVCYIDASSNTGNHSIPESTFHAGDLNISNVNEPLLSRITTKSGNYVDLVPMEGKRKDSYNSTGNALKKISLYNANNELQKGVELYYGYFEANTSRRYKDRNNKEVNTYDYLNYRLRLESIKEFSKVNEYTSPYHFEYLGDNNPATDDIYTLPYRLSPCQDHWGYYNGSYNKTIFPGNSNETYPFLQTDEWFQSLIDHGSVSLNSHVIYGANREPHAEAAKAGTLNKIIYPTGGYTKFNFEVNPGGLSSLRGGLRIKQIETYDNNGKTSKKNYYYNGYLVYSGSVNTNMVDHTYLSNPFLYTTATPVYASLAHIFMVTRSALSAMGVPGELVYGKNYNLVDALGNPLNMSPYLKVIRIDGTSPLRVGLEDETSYDQVIEETEGGGKTVFYYTNCNNQYDGALVDDNNSIVKSDAFIMGSLQTLNGYWDHKYYSKMDGNAFVFPYPSAIDYGWKNRLLNCKRVFDVEGKLVAEDSILYTTKILHTVPNFKVFQLSEYNYMYTRSYNIGGKVNIRKEVNRQYTPEGIVVRTSKEYDYLSSYHNKPTEIRTIMSQGGNVTEKYYYSTDYGAYFQTLVDKNILSPIDVRSYIDGRLVSGIQVKYESNGLPLTKYKNESTASDLTFNKSNPFTFTPYLWNTYNTINLLESQKRRDNISSIFLWGYKNQHPIAEIKNATLTEVTTVLNSVFGVNTIEALSALTIPNENKLKDGSLQRALPNAYVTTYTYQPLVGMLTSTDPLGFTTYYNYDYFGRLKEIYIYKDNIVTPANKQTIQLYDYHYQNQ